MAAIQDQLAGRLQSATATPGDLGPEAVEHISGALNVLLADVLALYIKTRNFHWHMSRPHSRDHQFLLVEHGEQMFALRDAIAERVHEIGSATIQSIGHVTPLRRLSDNDAENVDPFDVVAELREVNRTLFSRMREAYEPVRRKGRRRYGESTRPGGASGSASKSDGQDRCEGRVANQEK